MTIAAGRRGGAPRTDGADDTATDYTDADADYTDADTDTDYRAPADTARPHRRRRRWSAAVLVAAVLAALAWVVAFSPVLAAGSVTVAGTHRLSRAQIVAAAGVPLGTPLVRIPRSEIVRRVQRLAEVRSARVELSFPSTVVITVTERVSAAYRQTANGHFTFIDATGRSFADLATAPSGLPRLDPSGAPAADTATLATMAQISAALPASIRAHVDRLTATAADDIRVQLRDGRSVIWGDATRNADKIRILSVLLHRPGAVFDISNPDQVFVH